MQLTETEEHSINERAASFETHTGVQVVAAVIGKCDAYPEIPWKAFALGAAVAACTVVLLEWLRPAWHSQHPAVLQALAVLGTGAFCALLAMLKAHEAETSNQIAVLAVPSLEGESVEEYANTVFNTWKLGQKGKDNGVRAVIGRITGTEAAPADAPVETSAGKSRKSGSFFEGPDLSLTERILIGAFIFGIKGRYQYQGQRRFGRRGASGSW